MRSLASMAQEQGRSEADVEREILNRQAVPPMLEPADIAGVFLFLASSGCRLADRPMPLGQPWRGDAVNAAVTQWP